MAQLSPVGNRAVSIMPLSKRNRRAFPAAGAMSRFDIARLNLRHIDESKVLTNCADFSELCSLFEHISAPEGARLRGF